MDSLYKPRRRFGLRHVIGIVFVIVILCTLGLVGWHLLAGQGDGHLTRADRQPVNYWTGAGGNYEWADGRNWSFGTPVEDQSLVIDVIRVRTPASGTVDFTNGLSVPLDQLRLTGSAPGFAMTVSGTPLKIAGGIIVNPSSSTDARFTVAINTSVTLLKDQGVTVANADVRLSSSEDTFGIGSQRIKVGVGNGSLLTLGGALAGSGSMTVAGDVRTETATDGFTGALYINTGTVTMARENTFGSGSIAVRNGGTLALCQPDGSPFTLNNPLTVYGNGAPASTTMKKGVLAPGCAATSRVSVTGSVELGGNAQLGGDVAYSFAQKVRDNRYSLAAVSGSSAKILY